MSKRCSQAVNGAVRDCADPIIAVTSAEIASPSCISAIARNWALRSTTPSLSGCSSK